MDSKIPGIENGYAREFDNDERRKRFSDEVQELYSDGKKLVCPEEFHES